MAMVWQKKIAILGGGGMGTAIAQILADKQYAVKIWCFEPDVASDINTSHRNEKFLPGSALKPSITASVNIEEITCDAEVILFAIPSAFVLGILKQILHLENIREGIAKIGILTKGFVETPKGIMLIVDAMEQYLPGSYKGNLVYLSGPSHAEEIVRGKLTGLMSASLNGKESIFFRHLLSGKNLLVFPTLDVTGVQVCAALKNVIAIGFGMADALKEEQTVFGNNAESLILAAGLNEIQRVGIAMGSAYPETFTSIAGVGDLDVTCRSPYGRNRRFGREIIQKKIIAGFKNIDDLTGHIGKIGYLPEGAFAAKYMHQLAEKHKLRLPISESIYRVLNREAEPRKEVEHLVRTIAQLSRSRGE
ncbi:MAG: NAD(P)-dependent glycerol-3-phosphate dehydrogenase [Spirochaetales bacterium]|nr:NAD(P)-dependent glycerol-3-phosphate dehydrogenase [Spirochaetales bacterium]